MTLEAIWRAAVEFVHAHLAYAEPLVFFLGFAEGVPVLSLLVPSSALFLAVGAAHSGAGGSFSDLWLPAAMGAVVGDLATYSIGRLFRHDVARLRYFAGHSGALAAGHAAFERWGALAVIVGKFMGFARPFVPVVAGIVSMPWPLFLVASMLSSLAWAGVFLAPAYGFRWFVG